MKEGKLFNCIFSAMGFILLGVAAWIGNSASHIPTIETKLEDFMNSANKTLDQHGVQLHDDSIKLNEHEVRLHDLETRAKK